MYIVDLLAEPGREEHIARHGVTITEAEDVAFGVNASFRVRDGRYGVVGQTRSGRYVTIFVAPLGDGIFALITARQATANERRLSMRQRGR